MSMKQIKVSTEVKKQLDNVAYDKETYNITIQRLIRENEQLKKDKDQLMKIAMKTDDSIAFPNIAHSTFFLIMTMMSSIEYTDEERVNLFKKYLKPNLEKDAEAVRDMISTFESEYEITSPIINEIMEWIESEY